MAGNSLVNKVLTYAKSKAPDAVSTVSSALASKGQHLPGIIQNGGPKAQASVIQALAENGVSLSDYRSSVGLTPDEERVYGAIFAKYIAAEVEAVDAAAVKLPTTGDALLDVLAINREIDFATRLLSCSANDLYRIKAVFASLTEKQVERYQLVQRYKSYAER